MTKDSNMLRKASLTLAAAAASLAFAAPASAYTLNADGTGWVGKGEVQIAFGLNNKVMQGLHEGVSFTQESEAQYAQSCEKVIENKKETKVVTHDFKKTVTVNAVIASESRKTGQWTGWHLLGYGGTSDNGAVPTDLCNPGNDENKSGWTPDAEGVYPVVSLVAGSQSGGLYAHIAGYGSRVLAP